MNIEIPDPVEYKISKPCPECGVDNVTVQPMLDGGSVTMKEYHKKDCKLLPRQWGAK